MEIQDTNHTNLIVLQEERNATSVERLGTSDNIVKVQKSEKQTNQQNQMMEEIIKRLKKARRQTT